MLLPYFVRGVLISNFYIAMIAAFVLALLNALIRPILLILTLPINILTLGLFTLVINGFLFYFLASFVRGFDISSFWPAFWAALIYSIFSMFLNYFVGQKSER